MSDMALNTLLDLRRQFLGFLRRRVRDDALAEDILQSAYLRAMDASGSLREDESAVAWFYRILRNAIIDHHRRSLTETAALGRFAAELETETLPDPHLHETVCQCIASAIETLTPSYADLLRQVDLAETPLSTYAAAHGITSGNAAVRAHRARTALRKRLLACCGGGSVESCLHCTCSTTA